MDKKHGGAEGRRIKEKPHLPPSSYAKQSPYIQPSLAVNAGVDGQALYRPQQNFAQEVSLPDITHSVHQTNNSTQKQPPISVRNADMKTPTPPPFKKKNKRTRSNSRKYHQRIAFSLLVRFGLRVEEDTQTPEPDTHSPHPPQQQCTTRHTTHKQTRNPQDTLASTLSAATFFLLRCPPRVPSFPPTRPRPTDKNKSVQSRPRTS